MNTVSAQLKRLEDLGVVEKVPWFGEKKTGFQIAERFFNIWYLMRASRRVRRRLVWLVRFLAAWFTEEELKSRAERLLKRDGDEMGAERYAELSFAYAQVAPGERLRQRLEHAGLQTVLADDKMRATIDFSDLPPLLVDKMQRMAKMRSLADAVPRARAYWGEIDPRELWRLLLKDHLRRYDEAEAALRRSIELDPNYATLWNGLGYLLQDHLRRYDEAEAAYRTAIELDPNAAYPFSNLGRLYGQQNKPAAAASFYLRALRIEPSLEWIEERLLDAIRDLRSTQLETALTLARQTTETLPTSEDAKYVLAEMLVLTSQWTAAADVVTPIATDAESQADTRATQFASTAVAEGRTKDLITYSNRPVPTNVGVPCSKRSGPLTLAARTTCASWRLRSDTSPCISTGN